VGFGNAKGIIMEDFIDDLFSDVDVYYPGSKRKRKALEEKPKEKFIPKTWDSRPYFKTVNGKEVEFFTLGALADALGRPIVTLRLWMSNGQLPTSMYRLPDVTDKNGDVRRGRRLYTRSMIKTAVDIFENHGLLSLDRIDWSEHKEVSQELSDAWSNLRLDN